MSYLNTVPLVWGMQHGSSRGCFDLDFRVPAGCAEQLETGAADIGIIPAFELTRQRLEVLPGCGIACRGAVRSILLISRRPVREIRRLALDSSSRTSVQLARVILAERYGCRPEMISHPPVLDEMLSAADAALVIGDPALAIDPAAVPYHVLDLGTEWVEMTGLPMVFAVWAGRPEVMRPGLAEVFVESCREGLAHLDEIVRKEAPARGFAPALVRHYLTHNVAFEFGAREYQGLDEFLRLARLR